MIQVDIGHGRGWLAPEAAASVLRIDQQLGRPADINDAGRSAEQADENYRKWLAYQNGGPWAPYALPSWLSVHCKGGAADSDDWYDDDAAAEWRDNGWRQTARYDDDRDEPWHGEYFPDLDNHRNSTAGKVSAPDTQEDDDMRGFYFRDATNANRPYRFFNEARGKSRAISKAEWEMRKAIATNKGPEPLPELRSVSANWYDKIVELGEYK